MSRLNQLLEQRKQLETIINGKSNDNVKAIAKKNLDRINGEIATLEATEKPKEEPKKEEKKEERKPVMIVKTGSKGGRPKKEKEEKSETKEPKAKSEKSETKENKEYSDSDFEISEQDGATLVTSAYNRNWVMTIEPKGDKFKVSCCSEEKKHPLQDTKAKAIAYCKEWLHCKNLFQDAKDKAKKRKSSASKAKAKKLTTDIESTIQNTNEALEHKVEKKIEKGESIGKVEQNKIKEHIQAIVDLVTTDIKGKQQQKSFIEALINGLKKKLKEL